MKKISKIAILFSIILLAVTMMSSCVLETVQMIGIVRLFVQKGQDIDLPWTTNENLYRIRRVYSFNNDGYAWIKLADSKDSPKYGLLNTNMEIEFIVPFDGNEISKLSQFLGGSALIELTDGSKHIIGEKGEITYTLETDKYDSIDSSNCGYYRVTSETSNYYDKGIDYGIIDSKGKLVFPMSRLDGGMWSEGGGVFGYFDDGEIKFYCASTKTKFTVPSIVNSIGNENFTHGWARMQVGSGRMGDTVRIISKTGYIENPGINTIYAFYEYGPISDGGFVYSSHSYEYMKGDTISSVCFYNYELGEGYSVFNEPERVKYDDTTTNIRNLKFVDGYMALELQGVDWETYFVIVDKYGVTTYGPEKNIESLRNIGEGYFVLTDDSGSRVITAYGEPGIDTIPAENFSQGYAVTPNLQNYFDKNGNTVFESEYIEYDVNSKNDESVSEENLPESEEKGPGVMTYAEYVATDAVDMEYYYAGEESAFNAGYVTIEAYVQATQKWIDDTIIVYAQDKDGGYYIHDMECTEEDAKKLVPGTKIKVCGYKTSWTDNTQISFAEFEILEDSWIAEPTDVTNLLGTNELRKKENMLISIKGLKVDDIQYWNGKPGDDIDFKFSKNGLTIEAWIEVYLTGPETDVYKSVENISVGDTVDIEGFLYWYEGAPFPVITDIYTSSNSNSEPNGGVNTLTMATNASFEPYEYYEGGNIVGIDIDIANAIADKLGMELVVKDMEFDSITTAVKDGSVDFGMAGLVATEARLEVCDFTTPYASNDQIMIVKDGSMIDSIETFEKYYYGGVFPLKIGVKRGTTADIYASGDFLESSVIKYNDDSDMIIALSNDSVDCIITDRATAEEIVLSNETFKMFDTPYAGENYAICIAKENTELLQKMNDAIRELIADGTIERIIPKYA